MEKAQASNMNYQNDGLGFMIFISVLFINYIGVKVSLAGFMDVLEILFALPLKVLPFLTAYLAYRKQINEIGSDLKRWIKKKLK